MIHGSLEESCVATVELLKTVYVRLENIIDIQRPEVPSPPLLLGRTRLPILGEEHLVGELLECASRCSHIFRLLIFLDGDAN